MTTLKFNPKTINRLVDIRELIELLQKNNTNRDIADYLGYSKTAQVSQLKSGYRRPSIRKLGKLFKISGGKLDLSIYLYEPERNNANKRSKSKENI